MRFRAIAGALMKPAHPILVAIIAIAVLYGADWTRRRLIEQNQSAQRDLEQLKKDKKQLNQSLSEFRAMLETKSKEVAKFKSGLAGVAESKVALYKSGLMLQEEKRILEKQKEILTTYLRFDPASQRLSLMRGDQALQDFKILYSTPRAFGAEARSLPALTQVVSKERFAHPERGQSKEVDGKFEWTPPQVGESVRSNALGEFVIFTNGPLILHGPPKRNAEHEAFAHVCFGLLQPTAQKIYANTYIGTRIVVKAGEKPKE